METQLTVIIQPGEDGGYVAFIPEVPGAFSEGATVEEAREMVLDALNELSLARRELALRKQSAGTIVEPHMLSA